MEHDALYDPSSAAAGSRAISPAARLAVRVELGHIPGHLSPAPGTTRRLRSLSYTPAQPIAAGDGGCGSPIIHSHGPWGMKCSDYGGKHTGMMAFDEVCAVSYTDGQRMLDANAA